MRMTKTDLGLILYPLMLIQKLRLGSLTTINYSSSTPLLASNLLMSYFSLPEDIVAVCLVWFASLEWRMHLPRSFMSSAKSEFHRRYSSIEVKPNANWKSLRLGGARRRCVFASLHVKNNLDLTNVAQTLSTFN